ncbi:domain of unknown function DUF1745 [Methanococcus aeolicus Nankai-3]|uniref:Uncharacterized protein n=1 Tax=Methanococcus aeolicus (strain ATCC BAA-1280 / DSM 17508 / OCM 812 / Nankai-3) TaxID=419665 RepID=A6UWY9_META3|nr:FIST N-terminal domain-containing protein [Methanococcus aeolicus]ABR57011.1 domain of unknown function DUF1745 [Methanococcus aeolicus Nankai-3]
MKFIEFGYGASKDDNPLKAGAHATSDALKNLSKSSMPNVVFLFSHPDYNPEEVLNGVNLILGEKTTIVGGSSKYGIINNNLCENSVFVGILASKYFNVGAGVGLGISMNPRDAGKKAASAAMDDLGMMPKLMMVFMDYCKFEEEVLNGIVDVLGITTPIFGGTTSDDFKFKETYQYCNDAYFDSVVCVAIGGDIIPKISYSSSRSLMDHTKNNENTEYMSSDGNNKKGDITEGKQQTINYNDNKTIITDANKRYIYSLNYINSLKYYKNILNYEGSNTELQKDRAYYLSHPFGLVDSNGNIHIKGPISIKNDILICGSNVMKGNELKLVDINDETIKKLFDDAISSTVNTPPKYTKHISPLTFCLTSLFLTEISKTTIKECLKEYTSNPLFGFTPYGEAIFSKYMNYTVSMCSIVPDLISISAKEGIHMITKYPATKETMLKIDTMGGAVKIEELAKELGIHRRTAYDRVEPLLQCGFAEKDRATVKITEFGKLFLKFWFK